MRIVYGPRAFSRFERPANSEPLSAVNGFEDRSEVFAVFIQERFEGAHNAFSGFVWQTLLTIMNSLVLRSKKRRASSWPDFAPITRSHFQWPNSFRSSTSLGLSSILRPSFHLFRRSRCFFVFCAKLRRLWFLILKSPMPT